MSMKRLLVWVFQPLAIALLRDPRVMGEVRRSLAAKAAAGQMVIHPHGVERFDHESTLE